MPIYYFHLRNDLDVEDREGKDLPNFGRAQAEAVRLTRDMVAASAVESGSIDLRHAIEVADESGSILLTVHYGDAVEVRGWPIDTDNPA
jgi:hypothetical protein